MATTEHRPARSAAPHFPDAQHIESLRRALWTDREPGQAAVMVGAGMSRNAIPLRTGRSAMPSWEELTTALIDRLYPEGSGNDSRRNWARRAAGATSVANRLAEEYAVAFGRHDLDNLIQEAIPDVDFGPGPLHQLLLDLPWADVLTTNYDTLLERATATVMGRRYTVVRRPEEMSSSGRPRIVKLHGTFPSNGPFILTEDDFRTYPRKFAPFVNLARQTVSPLSKRCYRASTLFPTCFRTFRRPHSHPGRNSTRVPTGRKSDSNG